MEVFCIAKIFVLLFCPILFFCFGRIFDLSQLSVNFPNLSLDPGDFLSVFLLSRYVFTVISLTVRAFGDATSLPFTFCYLQYPLINPRPVGPAGGDTRLAFPISCCYFSCSVYEFSAFLFICFSVPVYFVVSIS